MSIGLKIPFFGLRKQYHNLRQEILDITDQVLRSGQIMNGNWTVEFEHWLAKTNNVRYAITCHSGTQALAAIAGYVKSMSGRDHPKVFLPSLTYPATANAFMSTGWDLHFIDVDCYGIMNLDCIPRLVEYDVVCLVGLYGSAVNALDSRRGLYKLNPAVVVEDAAQHWLSAGCVRVGTASAISFDPTKNLGNFGNGGAVLTNSGDLAEWARNWRDNSKPSDWRIEVGGTNSRMSEVDCAQMLIKVKHIDQWQKRREKIARYWMERLENSKVRCLIDSHNVKDHCFHKFVIECDHRDRVQKQMTVRQVETRIHYELPLHEMSIYRQFPGPDLLAVSSSLSRRVLSLPIYPELTDLEVEYVIDQLLDSVSEERN